MKPKRTLIALPDDIRVWNTYLSGLFFSREFTATLTQVSGSVTGNIKYTASAGIVALQIPQILGTSSATGGALVGLPDEIRPLNSGQAQSVIARITDNGTTAFGLLLINHTDTISLLTGATGGGFTASGTKGVERCVVVYALD
jgi:hypothetical protein